MNKPTKCYFCHSNIMAIENPTNAHYICKNCGELLIPYTVINSKLSKVENELYKFATIFRQRKENNLEILHLNYDNFEKIVSSYKSLNAIQKINNFILYVGKKAKNFGSTMEIDFEIDYTITYSENSDELKKIIEYCQQQGLIFIADSYGSKANVGLNYAGWIKFEELSKILPDIKQAFIAMWFDKKLEVVYEKALHKAIRDAGYTPMKINQKEHANNVTDEIIAEIRRSKFIVADFTGQRAGVYFEAGFAYGLGIPVIWACRKDEIEKLHFDTRQFNHIDWETEEELYQRLYNRIRAIIV